MVGPTAIAVGPAERVQLEALRSSGAKAWVFAFQAMPAHVGGHVCRGSTFAWDLRAGGTLA